MVSFGRGLNLTVHRARTREIRKGHDGAVDGAVVTREEKVHMVIIRNDCRVNRAIGCSCCAASVKGLLSAPSVIRLAVSHAKSWRRLPIGICWIVRSSIGKRCRAPLVGYYPYILR
jgi:hypothetical protein